MHSYKIYSIYGQPQASKHTHTCAQCSPTGLTQLQIQGYLVHEQFQHSCYYLCIPCVQPQKSSFIKYLDFISSAFKRLSQRYLDLLIKRTCTDTHTNTPMPCHAHVHTQHTHTHTHTTTTTTILVLPVWFSDKMNVPIFNLYILILTTQDAMNVHFC